MYDNCKITDPKVIPTFYSYLINLQVKKEVISLLCVCVYTHTYTRTCK